MFLDIGARAEQTFFFTTPQRDANGAIQRQVRGFENADGFHHDGAAGGVIGGAGAAVPRIEVSTEHDDFVFVFAGAGDFADDVEAIGWLSSMSFSMLNSSFTGMLCVEQPR